jgi:hypothetical protein
MQGQSLTNAVKKISRKGAKAQSMEELTTKHTMTDKRNSMEQKSAAKIRDIRFSHRFNSTASG